MTNVTQDRLALVIPGAMFGPYTPLLMYAGDAVEARGGEALHIWWSGTDDPTQLRPEERGPWVSAEITPALDQVALDRPACTPLLIGKSLASHAAVFAAHRQLPAIWFTPLLNTDWVVDALREAQAPVLLVGGTADRSWDGGLARQLTPYVHEIPDADHGLYVPGPLVASVAVLGQVVAAVEDFLDEHVWPS